MPYFGPNQANDELQPEMACLALRLVLVKGDLDRNQRPHARLVFLQPATSVKYIKYVLDAPAVLKYSRIP